MVIPVIQIAGWPVQRRPELEAGDNLSPTFVASATQGGVVAEFAEIGIRPTAVNTLLWITRIILASENAATRMDVRLGRTTTSILGSAGVMGWEDERLGITADPPVDCWSRSAAPAITFESRILVSVPANGSLDLPVNFLVRSDPDTVGRAIICQGRVLNLNLTATFFGYVVPILRRF
jgi:hypothetical protein